jgi:GntR family transcriptional regulator of arabinose operon
MSDLFERLPKYIQIKESLRKDILNGILHEGQQLSSEAELIRRFGASKMTVIRALQELVQEGFLKRIQGRGTFVTRPASHSLPLGLIVPCTSKGIFPVLIHEIEKEAHQMGYHIIICCSDDDIKKVENFARRCICDHVAGVIATPMDRLPNPFLNRGWYDIFQEAEIPVVLLDRRIKGIDNANSIETNNEDIMTTFTRELIKLGHKRILLAHWKQVQNSAISSRIRGFHKGASSGKERLEVAEVIQVCDRQPYEDSVRQFERVIQQYQPTAVMTVCDHIALHVMNLFKQVKGKPDDTISITGFGDLPFSEWIDLATVHQPLDQMGKKAVQLLHECIQGNKVGSMTIPSHIVYRASLTNINLKQQAVLHNMEQSFYSL